MMEQGKRFTRNFQTVKAACAKALGGGGGAGIDLLEGRPGWLGRRNETEKRKAEDSAATRL